MAWLRKLRIKSLLLRGSSLFLPVLPLSLSAVIGLFQARPLKLLISLSACACFIYAANRTLHYYRQLANALQQDQALNSIQDSRPQGLIAFSMAILLLSAYLIRQPLLILCATALGSAIYYFHYMYGQALPRHLDQQPKAIDLHHLSPTLQDMIRTGQNQANALEQLAQRYHNHHDSQIRRLSDKIASAAHKAQLLIKLCAEEADHIRRLRSFFIVQLPETLSICDSYLHEANQQTLHLPALDTLLDSVNLAFAEQSRALLAHDNIQLASKIDVLRQQLESSHSHDDR